MAEIVSPFPPASTDSGNGAGPKSSSPPPGADRPSAEAADGIMLKLIRPVGEAVWLADADGALVTARPVAASLGPGAAQMWTSNAIRGWAGEAHPHVIPPRGTATVNGSAWLISEYLPGVRLDRLLSAAILTPLQAAYIATDVLTGLAELHSASLVHGRLNSAAAAVGTDGIVRLTDLVAALPADADRREALRAADVNHARSLVAELARNADRPGARRRADAAGLLTGLVTLSASPDWSHAAAGLARLTTLVVDSAEADLPETDVRTQLAALAAAAERVDARTSARLGDPAEEPRRSRPPALPSGSLSDADWRPRRRGWVWAVVAVVVVAIALTAVFARGPVTSLADRLLHRHSGQSTSSSGPGTHVPRKVPTFAPAHAGPVRAITVRRLTPCTPAHKCRVRIAVRLQPAATGRTFHLTIRIVHRCSGLPASRQPSGLLRARAHARSAATIRTIAFPPGRALAAVVLTASPAHAAASPLLVPRHVTRC